MAKSTVQFDAHTLRVVWNSELVIGATGRASEKESWLKVKIEGAEGNVRAKFALLAESGLQFKIPTSQRERDAESGDIYYPRGLECAQLFAIFGDCKHYVDMSGFNAQKWIGRFPSHSQATARLHVYVNMLAAQAEQARIETEKASAQVVPDPETIQAVEADSSNRITESAGSPPVQEAETTKPGRKGKKQSQPV